MKSFCVWRPALMVVAAGALLTSSCRRDTDVSPATTTNNNSVIDNWILSNMRTWYYWNDKIPANPDTTQAPEDFFYSILYRYDRTLRPDGDRFSWIEPDANALRAELSGQSKTSGFEFNLRRRAAGSNDVIGQVVYVLPSSPADQAGLKRGDIFYAVDGQSLTISNYQSVLSATGDTHTYSFATVDASGTVTNTNVTKSLTAVVFQENPVYKDSTYTINGKTIGYLVYNQFVPGVYQANGNADYTFDRQMDAVFNRFKAKGVNELVLDLRYNPGGSILSARNLASSISPVATNSTVFARYEYNKDIMSYLQSNGGTSNLNIPFSAKSASIGSNLQRVFILTSRRTASASELIINGLKPYMNVVTIGDTTVGKNVGSFTISDSTGRIKYGLQPIVLKIFNAKGQSDYTAGFAPAVRLTEPLVLKPLGDLTERYLSEAVAQITGVRYARRGTDVGTADLASSVQRKAGGSNMFLTDPAGILNRLKRR